MIGGAVSVALRRALEISRELATIADSGDVQLTQQLDAERLQLLKFARGASQRLDDADRQLLQEITELNDKAIGFLEHRRRLKARDLDMISVGRRALRAYSATRLHR